MTFYTDNNIPIPAGRIGVRVAAYDALGRQVFQTMLADG